MRKIYSKIYILGILEKAKSHPLETYDFSAVVAVIISKEIFDLKKNETICQHGFVIFLGS